MSNLEKLREKMQDISKRCMVGFIGMKTSFNSTLKDWTEINNKEIELAKVSSWDFVCAFRNTAKELSEMLPEPNKESYILFANEAIEMLAGGKDPAEVLWHFDLKLIRMREGKR